LKSPQEGHRSRKENKGGDESIWGILHTYIWKCHNNPPPYNYHKLTKNVFKNKKKDKKVK
jgi:hypothetical protein